MEDLPTKSGYNYDEEHSLLWIFFRMTCGALLGGLLSFIVNSALVEVSINPFFAFYIAILLYVVGTAIILRVQKHRDSPRRYLLIMFGFLVITAGLLCMFFHREWIFKLSKAARAPLYALIGCSLCFSIAFCTLDFINFTNIKCQPGDRALIDSRDQINLLLGTSVVMGIGFGLAFGMLGVGIGVVTTQQFSKQFAAELLFSIPFGFLLGATSALLNEYLRNRQGQMDAYKYSPLFQEDTMI